MSLAFHTPSSGDRHQSDSSPRPLSIPQERLWLVDQLAGATSVYNVPVALRLTGRLDPVALERALNSVVARHDALRARFVNVKGEPVQHVVAAAHVPMPVVSVESMPEAEREAAALRLARESAFEPFDLTRAPLVRALLVRFAADDHLVVWTFHHIVFDGWSIGPLYREIETFYVGGSPDPLAIQYPDFAEWQREQDGSQTAGYWARTLAGAGPPPVPVVSTERRRPVVPPGGTRSQQLGSPVSDAIACFCRDRRTTPFTVYLAAFAAWLAQRTGRDDVIVAVPMAGRTLPETQALIGFFVNSLPLRVRVPASRSFLDLVSAVRSAALDAFANQDVTAAALREALPAPRASRHGSLIPVAFAHETAPVPPTLPGVRATTVFLEPETAKNDFTMIVSEGRGAAQAQALYAADCVTAADVDTALHEYVALLEAAIARPDETVAALCAAAAVPAGRPFAGGHGARVAGQAAPAGRSNLTIAQTATWMTQVMYPGVPITYIPTSVRIKASLDVSAFARAFRSLVASTDALRMVIRDEDGVPMQEEDPDCDATLELVEMARATDEEIDCWVQNRCARPPDVHQRSFDSALLTIGPSDHLWFLQQHHVFGDGWSSLMIRDRFSRFYLREIGEAVEIPEAFPRWLDAANDIRAYQESAAATADRERLASLMSDEIEAVQFFGLPHRKDTTVVVRDQLTLDNQRTRTVQARAAEASNAGWDAANFYLIGAALVAYLHRVTGRRWVSFGAPYHNRRPMGDRQAAARLKRTCGLFMDVLPVVVEVEPDDTFARLIEKVRNAWAVASRHALGGTPPEVRQRGCDVLLNYLPPMPQQLFGTTATVTWVHPGHEIESFAIQVREYEQPERLEFLFDFHADVFPEGTRPLVIAQFTRVLDACVDEPARRVRDVDLLSDDQRVQVLERWNDTSVAGTTDRLVTDLFDEQATRNPRAIAVEADGERVTYEDLRGRAARLASELTRQGAGPETVVGLCVPRSTAQIAALLGILRAGAAYLPLDPVLPDDRVETVMEDAGVALVVTTAALRNRRPFEPRTVVTIEDVDAEPVAGTPQPFGPASLAYVIYTSGSTGTPKGVEITHAGLANFVSFAVSYFGLTAADRVLQFASLSFDTAAEEIFPALAVGATLVLRTDRMLDSVDEFLDGCVQRSITVLDLPTAYWHTIIDVAATRREFPSNIRAVILGGEAVRPDMLARWRQWVGTRVTLLNGYGPTETTVCATYTDLTCAPEPPQGPVSIGRPVWNTHAYVLDAAGQPVAPGLAGELHVGGTGLARGYRGAPEMTNARFVPDPWRSGERLYRTGDRVRWRCTGELEYLGRLDQQVKVRGYRVEPGEIEARLHAHPAVREAAVVAQVVDGDTRLIAYVCGAAENPVTVSDLREFLAARLPGYMVPHGFALLDRLPRSLSGKVDRHALPAPAAGAHEVAAVPRTPAEIAIAAIWRDLLGLPSVGTDQNFFDLGGHSLLGTRMVARIADALGVSVPLWMLFEHPTVAALAAALSAAASSRSAPAPSSAVAPGRRGAKPLTRARTPAPSNVRRSE